MCRNIRTLVHFEPPASEAEIGAAALQFVRKIMGTSKPARANEVAFERAVAEVAAAAQRLIASSVSAGPPRSREVWAARAKERAAKRFGGEPGASSPARGASSPAAGE